VSLPSEAAPDSFNCLPAIADGARSARESLVLEGRAIRKGAWKYLLRKQPEIRSERDEGGALAGELFNLAEDIGETADLAEKRPEIAKELHANLIAVRASKRTR